MSKSDKLKGGQAAVQALKKEKTKHVFGLIGSATIEMFDALYHEKDIKFIGVRDERTGTHMADGYARASNGPGVILAGQVGVGNRVNVGSKVIASSKCGIHADVNPGEVVSGFPAIPNKLWLRCSANFKKLPEIAKALRKLNRSV